ncbi:helix-turn-helix transcriptional regulator [Streptomyces europaeiscabiei]|uniref:Helix-turn-helix transcriptional regulator n=1 Tax=Streptomyces europaeiscabiei TaxID=146819 RepID=A0ABU4NUU5_9ACTN|nr:helix-turn-helix transcriptional regulator [Streptomyces europaeiscabiei]MDX2771435.1 helix-turn-helix transcriptional regulator [Streptomyces europaeiscabiei]MDX3555321.1 helix-turn-helix transcriptional regulator [Streptomyces europaeiscabiei]MDX3705335.1 helix-turn-helix transcriptional regulator [Streptomyces europaeiscabiei]
MASVTQDPEAWARLGAKIREQRESLDMSRRQLSEAAGVSEKSIQVAEEGRTPRARWPQSLRLIESALRWEPGSMMQILEGGEPEPVLDLFSYDEESVRGRSLSQLNMFPSLSTRLSAEDAEILDEAEEFPSNHGRSAALARLPKALRAALVEVLSFGSRARTFGASPNVVEEYERAVEALLVDLTSRPLTYRGGPGEGTGHLAVWARAMRMDPVLRREREERMRAADRERRRIAESEFYRASRKEAERTPVVGDDESIQLKLALQELTEQVTRLSVIVETKEKKSAEE